MVDGIITLRDTTYAWRVERDMQVRKFRGSDHLGGRHAVRISAEGITVWPRIEALPLPGDLRVRSVHDKLSTGRRRP